MKTLFILASVMVVLFLAAPNKVNAQKRKATKFIEGTISRFECGHACYLTIIDKKGKKYTRICLATFCDAWWAGGMPARYKGKRVRVTVAKETILLDIEGADPFTADAIQKIQFLKRIRK